MVKLPRWKENLKDIISASQESAKAHERLIAELQKVYESTDKKDFVKEFLQLLLYPLTFKEKSSLVGNCLSFFAKFAVSTAPAEEEDVDDAEDLENVPPDQQHHFFISLVDFLLGILSSTNATVRWRVCNFLELLLSECASQKRSRCISDNMWDRLVQELATRCRDKAVYVRLNAVSALSKLQQPKDPDCPAIRAIAFLMRFDPSPVVRAQCIRLVSPTKTTIAWYVERCRDVNELVRRALYSQIANRNLFKYLTIEQRLKIINGGLADPAEAVRKICERGVITSWLAAVDEDIPDLIRRLDLITSEKTCEMLLQKLFDQKASDAMVDTLESMTLRWESDDWLTPERIFCLRHFVSFILATPKDAAAEQRWDAAQVDEWMERLLPPLYSLVEFVEGYITKPSDPEDMDLIDGMLHRSFMVRQLLELLATVDKSDIAGRNRLQKMFETVVPVVNDVGALSCLVRIHLDTYRKVESTIEWVAEIISELTVVPTQPVAIGINGTVDASMMNVLGDIAVEENNVTDDDDDDTSNFAFLELLYSHFGQDAQHLSLPLISSQADMNLFKSLTLLSEVLKSVEVKTLTTTLRSLYENLVLPAIQNQDPATRNLAFRCLGLSCLLDRESAKKHIGLFLQTLSVDVDTVRKTAVEVLFDLLLVFRTGLVDITVQEGNDVPNGPTIARLFSELSDMLDNDEEVLHDVVAEGIAKLRIYAPDLLPRRSEE